MFSLMCYGLSNMYVGTVHQLYSTACMFEINFNTSKYQNYFAILHIKFF